MSDKPTMADVAELASVALKTVSRVVNGEAHVTPATAARVQAAIAELGYERNEMAASLRWKVPHKDPLATARRVISEMMEACYGPDGITLAMIREWAAEAGVPVPEWAAEKLQGGQRPPVGTGQVVGNDKESLIFASEDEG